MNDKKQLPEINVPASGHPEWAGGAWTISFVYSNKGNFVLKGYYREVNEYLDNLITKGYKFFVNHSLWSYGQNRDIWKFWDDRFYLSKPDTSSRRKQYHWEIRAWRHVNPEERKKLKFKRMPKRWIPEFESL